MNKNEQKESMGATLFHSQEGWYLMAQIYEISEEELRSKGLLVDKKPDDEYE